MRTRLIRPTFWADKTIAALPVPVRLTFMGLWGLSDDDGYFEWEPSEIAAELYRWESVSRREHHVEDHLDRLVTAGPVRRLACLVHGLIPSMPLHRIQSGRHTFPTRDQHRNGCLSSRGIPGPAESRSDTESVSPSARNGSDMGGLPPATVSPLGEAARAAGGPVASFATPKDVRH